MSRSGSIQQALGDTEIRVRAIKPNGDCFKDDISVNGTAATSFATDYVSPEISLPTGGCV